MYNRNDAINSCARKNKVKVILLRFIPKYLHGVNEHIISDDTS